MITQREGGNRKATWKCCFSKFPTFPCWASIALKVLNLSDFQGSPEGKPHVKSDSASGFLHTWVPPAVRSAEHVPYAEEIRGLSHWPDICCLHSTAALTGPERWGMRSLKRQSEFASPFTGEGHLFPCLLCK